MKFSHEESANRELRNLALIEDPFEERPELNGKPVCTVDVLDEIQNYIQHSYQLSANPLSHLRKYFPNFAWSYIKPRNIGMLTLVVERSDYAWLLSAVPGIGWSPGIVTASEINRESHRKLCYIPGEFTIDSFWPEEELRACGVRLI